MKQNELLEIIIKAMPFNEDIEDIDLTSKPGDVIFTWRDHRLSVSEGLLVLEDEGAGGCFVGNHFAIIVEQLIKMQSIYYLERIRRKEREKK